MEHTKFTDLNLSTEMLRAVSELGFEAATPIQSLAIPVLLEGKDIIGQAQTGTGKTAAFGIPIIEKVNPQEKDVQAIILCPTRELAIQVAEELTVLARYKQGIKILPIYGGQPIERQLYALKREKIQIVVATPGRMCDHIDRKTISLEKVKIVTLDEADEMLDMGFRDDIEFILKQIKDKAQMVFFSATMAPEILGLAKRYLNNPQIIKVQHKELTVSNIEQYYIEVKDNAKVDLLSKLLDFYNPKLSVIFANTKRMVDILVDALKRRGYRTGGLHGDKTQRERDRVMDKFRKGDIEFLIATDIAGRGIDVENVEMVINFDIPTDEEDYVHRIGRTGRAGRAGKAITFVLGREMYHLKRIKQYTKKNIAPLQAPSSVDIEARKSNEILEAIKSVISKGHLTTYTNMVEEMCKGEITSQEVAAALLKMKLENNKLPN